MEAEQLGQKLLKKTGLTPDQIQKQTQDKIQEYKPLVTDKTSAVILVGKEHGIDLVDKNPPELDIENIVPEINDITIKAKVKSVDKFTYQKDGETRKGCDLTLYDNTGEISMMIWGDDVNEINENIQGEKVEVAGSYSSKYQGEVQLNYSKETTIKKIN